MPEKEIRVAVVGVGNCASALIQGLEFYKAVEADGEIPGVMHPNLAGYFIRHIKVVAAFDVAATKVGYPLAVAIHAPPNNAMQFTDVQSDVIVQRGPLLDGFGKYLKERVPVSSLASVNVTDALKKARAEIVVNFCPVGSAQATRYYAQAALDAGCAFINCIPEFIASDEVWAAKFEERGLPVIGDDVKSQLGATIIHRVLSRLFVNRGVWLDRTYQLNFGGNGDFLNMLERSRLTSKKISKTQSVNSMLPEHLGEGEIHIGPSDYVPFLKDQKNCYIRMEGRNFGHQPVTIELKLEVQDSPNSAGVVIDAIRCAKLALDRGLAGVLIGPSAYFMKSPPEQMPDWKAFRKVEEFINERR